MFELLKIEKKNKITPKNIQYSISDELNPDLIISVPTPAPPALNFNVQGYLGGGFNRQTIQGQSAQVYVTLTNTLKYMMSKTAPNRVRRWAAVNNLNVIPRAGRDLNAFYDRSNLKFFFYPNPLNNKTFYTCETPDIVAHEFGHAYLDILRPDLWSTQAVEIWAFHESFGDITAILSIMQFDQILDLMIKETDLLKSNIVSKLAEEFGRIIYALGGEESGNLPDCLRDAVNEFVYVEPEKLSNDGPDNILTRECHNFSRVWTGTWYELMIEIYKKNLSSMEPKAALVSARDISAKYLLDSVLLANTGRFFSSMAKNMLNCDKNNNNKYQEILNTVFVNRKIISPTISILSNINYEEIKNMASEIISNNYCNIVNTGNKSMKLNKNFDFMALSNNPLLDKEIDVPSENTYIFDKNKQLIDYVVTSQEEIANEAFSCLNYLNNKNLVGKDNQFKIKKEKLIRNYIICRCGNNACDPNAPEYGKGWKGQNNAGCCSKGAKSSCNCSNLISNPVINKIGCFSKTKCKTMINYKSGSTNSLKSC